MCIPGRRPEEGARSSPRGYSGANWVTKGKKKLGDSGLNFGRLVTVLTRRHRFPVALGSAETTFTYLWGHHTKPLGVDLGVAHISHTRKQRFQKGVSESV